MGYAVPARKGRLVGRPARFKGTRQAIRDTPQPCATIPVAVSDQRPYRPAGRQGRVDSQMARATYLLLAIGPEQSNIR